MFNNILSNVISRPIANFHPCHWGDYFSKLTHYDEATQVQKEQEVKQLKEGVKKELLETKGKPVEQLILIDAIERLGVAYHFEGLIEEALEEVFKSFNEQCALDDLFHVSLRFRILRQHGYFAPCDVFNKFKDENGSFKDSLTKDTLGLLSLYEASHARVRDDRILDEALAFSTTHLKAMLNQSSSSIVDQVAHTLFQPLQHLSGVVHNHLGSPLADQVAHALHQPLHKGMPRVESRHYISIYEQDPSHNKTLLKLAKHDFNLLQSLHQKELKDLVRWWKDLHIKTPFSRDRSTEGYFWILGVYYEPQYSSARKILRKIFKATSLLDDTFDAYGTLEELESLVELLQRPWDKSCAEDLPEHVKWPYYALVETCEEAEDDLAKEGRSFCVNYTREQVKSYSQACLQEAKWCHQNYVPTYDEYMKIALITSPYPHGVVASFLGMGEIATKEVFEWASKNPMPNIVKAASIMMRLMNDISSHKFEQKRNHVASAIECLIKRHGMSEEEANTKVSEEVENAWKDINEAMLQPYVIPKPFLTRILNLARSTDVIYKGMSDGYTEVNQTLKDHITSVLAHSVPL